MISKYPFHGRALLAKAKAETPHTFGAGDRRNAPRSASTGATVPARSTQKISTIHSLVISAVLASFFS